jgi:hypothetical protein
MSEIAELTDEQLIQIYCRDTSKPTILAPETDEETRMAMYQFGRAVGLSDEKIEEEIRRGDERRKQQ